MGEIFPWIKEHVFDIFEKSKLDLRTEYHYSHSLGSFQSSLWISSSLKVHVHDHKLWHSLLHCIKLHFIVKSLTRNKCYFVHSKIYQNICTYNLKNELVFFLWMCSKDDSAITQNKICCSQGIFAHEKSTCNNLGNTDL